MDKLKKKFIGDKAFYKMLLVLVLPLIVQQGITSSVNLLDNVMVGKLGTEAISAVAIVNQIITVFNLAIFGGLSGCSIFGAQFFGKKDYEGMKQTFRFKMMFALFAAIVSIVIFIIWGENFISLFLTGSSDGGDLELTAKYAKQYLTVMLFGLIPFALVQTYTSTLRESGETLIPMIGSTGAIVINLCLNYLLIFGKFGCPRLEVEGAAIATVIARFFEILFIAIYAQTHTKKYQFLHKAFSSLYVSSSLIKKIARTGSPLLFNEIFWSFGMTVVSQCYSTRGLSAVAAVNITTTIWNLFSICMIATGNGVSILVGQRLGAGDKEGARDVDNKMLFVALVSHIVMGALLVSLSGAIPMIYNVEPEVRHLASNMLIAAGCALPIHSIINCVYFTIRTGGKTIITFLFDCVYTWVVSVPLAFCLAHFTKMPILWMYTCVQFIDIIKLTIGLIMLRSDFWLNNIVNDKEKEQS
jgi:putative MATE family efflux protein